MILLLLALLALPQGAAPAERRYAVTDFDRVLVEGPVTVELTTGRPSAAAAYGAQNALDRVTVDVQGTRRCGFGRTAPLGEPPRRDCRRQCACASPPAACARPACSDPDR